MPIELNAPVFGVELKLTVPSGGVDDRVSVSVAVHDVELSIGTVEGEQVKVVVVASTAVSEDVPILAL
jgi:hypothetical protein